MDCKKMIVKTNKNNYLTHLKGLKPKSSPREAQLKGSDHALTFKKKAKNVNLWMEKGADVNFDDDTDRINIEVVNSGSMPKSSQKEVPVKDTDYALTFKKKAKNVNLLMENGADINFEDDTDKINIEVINSEVTAPPTERVRKTTTTTPTVSKHETECGTPVQSPCCRSIITKLKDGKELSWTKSFSSGSGSSSSTNTTITLKVNDDKKCGGTETKIGKGSVVSSFTVLEEFMMKFDGIGRGEQNYETFTVKIDGIDKFNVKASTGNINGIPCKVHTCNMCPIRMDPIVHTFTKGPHTIEVSINTRDGKYNDNVYFTLHYVEKLEGCDHHSCVPDECGNTA